MDEVNLFYLLLSVLLVAQGKGFSGWGGFVSRAVLVSTLCLFFFPHTEGRTLWVDILMAFFIAAPPVIALCFKRIRSSTKVGEAVLYCFWSLFVVLYFFGESTFAGLVFIPSACLLIFSRSNISSDDDNNAETLGQAVHRAQHDARPDPKGR